MISNLRRKMMILVVTVLVLVSSGIVISINLVNWRQLETQAESVLNILAENAGLRPQIKITPWNVFGKKSTEEQTVSQDVSTSEDLNTEEETTSEETVATTVIDEVTSTQLSFASNTQDQQPDAGAFFGEERGGQAEPGQIKEGMQQDGEMIPQEERQDFFSQEQPQGAAPFVNNNPGSSAGTENNVSADPAPAEAPSDTEQEESETETEKIPSPGQPVETENSKASLANYYVVYLSEDNTVESWSSDRADLYTDAQVADMTALALSSGKESGKIGTQFYKFTEQNGQKMLIVLDARVEVAGAKSVLKITIIIAALACALLSGAAYILIRKMVRPVQDAFEKQKQFVWDASHELKTPLAVIGANADVLEMEVGQNEYLGYIQSEVKRTNRLVQDLLSLARMDQTSQKNEMKKLDLGNTILSVALPFESKAFEEEKELTVQAGENLYCQGDEAMLKQLTVILLSNAFKYSDSKGKIDISAAPKGSGVEICVSNTGAGIPLKDQKRIFDRFFRADPSRNREVEGFGLGLSLAKKIVDLHKGKIWVHSVPDEMTEFHVLLPGA